MTKANIRNSTTDFLVFTKDSGASSIEVRVQDGDVWLTQKAMAELFDVGRPAITKHLKSIYVDGELERNSTCAKFAQVADIEQYRILQDKEYLSDFDRLMLEAGEAEKKR